ncbi:MAG: hypothetical protein OXH66_00370 [Gemmatimonadetes bacterium]|nr:hypothetical protein [Gemmatimonadota bacterium]
MGDDRSRAQEAARRVKEGRRRLAHKATIEELVATVHEGHRY